TARLRTPCSAPSVTPSSAFMAATAQAQSEATKEAQRAGIAHAKANGDGQPYKGRKPSYSRKQFENAQAMLGKSASFGEVARAIGLTRQTVYRITGDLGHVRWKRLARGHIRGCSVCK